MLAATVFNAIANIAFKKAVTNVESSEVGTGLLRLLSDPWTWLGLISAVLLLGSYLYALRGIELSVAYPAVTGLAMLGVALGGAIFLGESLTFQKILAICLIICGVYLLKQ